MKETFAIVQLDKKPLIFEYLVADIQDAFSYVFRQDQKWNCRDYMISMAVSILLKVCIHCSGIIVDEFHAIVLNAGDRLT